LGIHFKKRVQKMRILDPADNFKETVLSVETRWDPLIKRTVRVLSLPIQKFPVWDPKDMLEKDGSGMCPFCPEALEKVTPQFVKDFIPEGRLRSGEVCIFPNRIPFDRYCAVVVFTKQHYVPLADFTEDILFKAFSAARTFLCRVVEVDPAVRFFSVNWNYLPMAGGSIIHPHLQILAGELPTSYQGDLIQACRRYQKRRGKVYWEELIDTERNLGERYIGSFGDTVWLASYAPLGVTDILSVFRKKTSLIDLPDRDLKDFAQGLHRVFDYFQEFNHTSFNLGLYAGDTQDNDSFRINARLVTRRLLPPVGASDVSYFEKIHRESLDYKNPERLCKEIRAFFEERDRPPLKGNY
jgi:UDPglucose--hexose-1-phosphate uridylyltransferase